MTQTLSRNRNLYIYTTLWALLYLGALAATVWTIVPSEPGFFIIIVIGVPLTVLMALEWSKFIPGRKTTVFLLLAGIAWWVATAMLVRGEFAWRLWYPLNTVTLLLIAFTVGYWLAGEIEKAGHLIPVSILGTIVDIWSVFHGPSKSVGEQVVEHAKTQVMTGTFHAPPFVEFLILSWPQPGASYMTPLFGFGDLVFIAIFLAGSRRFGIPLYKTVLLLLAGLGASIALAFFLSIPIPALPLLCGFFLLGNFRNLSLTKAEWRLTLIICAALLFAGFLNYFRSTIMGE